MERGDPSRAVHQFCVAGFYAQVYKWEEMIDFTLSQEQLALKETVAKFVEKEVRPLARELDESSRWPQELIDKAWKLGLMNSAIGAEYGGLGLGVLDDVIINEELGAGCLGVTTTLTVNNLALYPILLGGTPEQIKEWGGRLLAAPKVASFCLTEPGSGSDAASLCTLAKDCGDHYLVNGSKMWISNAGYAEFYTVFATVDVALKQKGMVCLVVPRTSQGIQLGKPEQKLGQHASDTRAITFENVKVPKKDLIGKVGEGFKIALRTLDHTRTPIVAGAIGAARAALEHSVRYAKERKQFGKPIADFQAIQFMLADMSTKIEAARALAYRAAFALDNKDYDAGNYYSAHAKRFGADMAMEVATDAVQIFGGYGYTREYPVEKIMRDVKLVQIYEGTSQIQRMVIARHLLKEQGRA